MRARICACKASSSITASLRRLWRPSRIPTVLPPTSRMKPLSPPPCSSYSAISRRQKAGSKMRGTIRTGACIATPACAPGSGSAARVAIASAPAASGQVANTRSVGSRSSQPSRSMPSGAVARSARRAAPSSSHSTRRAAPSARRPARSSAGSVPITSSIARATVSCSGQHSIMPATADAFPSSPRGPGTSTRTQRPPSVSKAKRGLAALRA